MTNAPATIVGITTLPSRIELMRPCLDSLLSGELPPDVIYVSVPSISVLENKKYEIPAFFQAPEYANKVKVVHCETDYGPGTKLLGLLPLVEKPSVVVLADDDMRYQKYFLSRLVEHQRAHHDRSFSFYAYAVSGLIVGQGADGFSFWSPNLDGVDRFYDSHIAGTDLMFHDDLWISFWLMAKRVKVTSLRHELRHKLIYEEIHRINQLSARSDRLERKRLVSQVSRLFSAVEAPSPKGDAFPTNPV